MIECRLDGSTELNWRTILGTIGSGALIAAVLLIGVSLIFGYFLAGRDPGMRSVSGLGALAGAERAAEVYEFGLGTEDILAIADQIPAGGAALLMLVEHTWLIPLRDAIRAQGGIVYAQEFLSPEALMAVGAELAAVQELYAAGSEE